MQGKTSKMIAMTFACMLLAEPAFSQAMAKDANSVRTAAAVEQRTASTGEESNISAMKPDASNAGEEEEAIKKKLESLKHDPDMQKLRAEMKALRSQMRTLHEQKVMLIAKKLGISTDGKTLEQIRQELEERTNGKIGMFHEKHVGSKEGRYERLQQFAEKQGISTEGLTEEQLKAKLKEWREQQRK